MMINPPHNDAYSFLTNEELISMVRAFATPQSEDLPDIVEVLDGMVQALAGRLEKQLEVSQKRLEKIHKL